MTHTHLKWQSLLPDTTPYEALFLRATDLEPVSFEQLQPRLSNALTLFCDPKSPGRFMLVKAQDSDPYLSIISQAIEESYSEPLKFCVGHYVIRENKIHWFSTDNDQNPFAPQAFCLFQSWIEPEQLFGGFKCHQNKIDLQPGLVHRVNGGVLVISVRTLLAQPLMWLRLKQMIIQKRFEWISPDEKHPLPVHIPSMPLDLKLVLVGDAFHLEDFLESELNLFSFYGEFETELSLTHPDLIDLLQNRNGSGEFDLSEAKSSGCTSVRDHQFDKSSPSAGDVARDRMSLWCRYVNSLTDVPLSPDAWPVLIREAVRETGHQDRLPLCPMWIKHRLSEASLYEKEGRITIHSLNDAFSARHWRQNYLSECIQNDINEDQIFIETTGDVIGQVNGLAVIEYPGHPQALGEPARISCVVHLGDGELVDVERKAELGGNTHAKGMMIMQAFLISELALDQPQPFSASIVFEQSYAEVDGDSASLAGLCALVSALAQQPVYQEFAVTGSIDQFGRVQPIGGINEKIEGFFQICDRRGLTGTQGVILPSKNIRYLCLDAAVIEAVKKGLFHLWAVDTVADALPLLTGMSYFDENKPNLLHKIQQRIAQAHHRDRRGFLPGCLEWFKRS